MAGVWALENALLMGCYAFGAGMAAAAIRGPPPPHGEPQPHDSLRSATPSGGSMAVASLSQQRVPTRSRRGKPSSTSRRANNHSNKAAGIDAPRYPDDEDNQSGRHDTVSLSAGSTATSTVLSDGGFASCVSACSSSSLSPQGHRSIDEHQHVHSLPMCLDDAECGLLNDPAHFTRLRHTCRLAHCPSSADTLHCRYFAHEHLDGSKSDARGRVSANSTASTFESSPAVASVRQGSAGGGSSSASATYRPSRPHQLLLDSAAVQQQQQQQHVAAAGVALAAGRLAHASVWSDGSDSATSSPHAHVHHNSVDATPLIVQWLQPRKDAADVSALQGGGDCSAAPEERTVMVCGDWKMVRVHTFKQYLRQITGIPAATQMLRATITAAAPLHRAVMGRGRGVGVPTPALVPSTLEVFMTDDTATVGSYLSLGSSTSIATTAVVDGTTTPIVTVGIDDSRRPLLPMPVSSPPLNAQGGSASARRSRR